MFFFSSVFFLTNIVFSLLLCSFYLRFFSPKDQHSYDLIIPFLGLGPAFTTLLLYYLFLFFPGKTDYFYFYLIISVYFILGMLGKKELLLLLSSVSEKFKKSFISNKDEKDKFLNIFLLLIFSIGVICYFFILFTEIAVQPLDGHDILNYGIVGNMLHDAKSLLPVWIENYSLQGFIYKVTCAPGFSLLLTWEKIAGSVFNFAGDMYFKSVSGYYAVLIIFALFFSLARFNKLIGFLCVLALLSVYSFYIKFFLPHIDTFRMFFLIMSFVYLAYSVKYENFASVILFGVFSGFAAYSHRIGIIICAINFFVFFIMFGSSFKTKILNSILACLIILSFGGSHYIFDIIWGRGVWFK